MNWARFQQGLNHKDFGDFDSKNISNKQMKSLRVDANSGYREAMKYTGARPSIGRSASTKGTGKTDYNYYKNHPGWSAIANEIGIKNINSDNDISQMYDFTNNYSRSAQNSSPTSYGNAPSSQGKSSIDFTKQLNAIKAENQASMDALTQRLSDQKADYDQREADANSRISSLSSTVANAQSMYDPTKGMGSSNNINPALSIQEQGKKLSSGTQRYNRNKLSINNLNL
ncbi:MAG: hypothetical protein CBC48_05430 [bacterium TMED88]|nr:MAG: hypothetical protein CBC48_05430 [bacterium TMED88]